MRGSMPSARRRLQYGESARSEPVTSAPSARATRARPLMPAPPTPTKWILRPARASSLIAATIVTEVAGPAMGAGTLASVRFRTAIAFFVVVAAVLVAAAAASAVAPAPVNQAPPQIKGPSPPQDGLTYTTKPGQWDGPPGMTIARQWLRCNAAATVCQPVAGAT